MDQPPSLPYTITPPVGEPGPLVMSSPHSGRTYPQPILDRLRIGGSALLALGDGPIDRLIRPACAGGAVMIAARYPRVVVDLNREPDELDPDLVDDPDSILELRVTARARAGLGIVPSRVGGQALWRDLLCARDLRSRLDLVFDPYHAEVDRLLRERRERHGIAVLLDCHSMPSVVAIGEPAVDVALGDRFGRSCAPEIVAAAEAVLRAAGLRVARNKPYAGGYITGRHGRPEAGAHALQVELRRGLFMDEVTHAPHAGFSAMRDAMAAVGATLGATALGMAAVAAPPTLAQAS